MIKQKTKKTSGIIVTLKALALWALVSGSLFIAAILLTGCPSKQLYRDAAQSGWERWEEDKRPTLSNEDYTALSEEERKLYLPEAKVKARLFEKENALRLLKD